MLMMKERQVTSAPQSWATSVLLEVNAICQCESRGRMRDRTDAHARERALVIARRDPPWHLPGDSNCCAL